jgi:hypothetical protein
MSTNRNRLAYFCSGKKVSIGRHLLASVCLSLWRLFFFGDVGIGCCHRDRLSSVEILRCFASIEDGGMRQATLDVATTRAPASRREGSGIEGSDAEDILAGNRGNDAVTINDLPSEVLLRIIAFVDSPWVLVQAQRASSRLFGGASPAALAAVWGADRLHRLIHADAPLAVIEAAMDQRTRPLFRRLIVIAARHGRVDVMRLTSNRIQVRQTLSPTPHRTAPPLPTLFFSSSSSCRLSRTDAGGLPSSPRPLFFCLFI